jgi:hypothetical protein
MNGLNMPRFAAVLVVVMLLMATTASTALADNRPDNVPCTEQSADKGALGPIIGDGGTPSGQTHPVCPLTPGGDG